MEIERKFVLSSLPDLPLVAKLDQWQGYLTTDPEVRIRHTINHTAGTESYILCIKSKGTLVRHEIEVPLSARQFDELCQLLTRPLIHKELHAYRLPDGLVAECSRVDGGIFSYGEVEFPTQEEALSWSPPAWLGPELTHQQDMKMSLYWSNPEQFLQNLSQTSRE